MKILITGCNGQLGNEIQLLEKLHPQHIYYNLQPINVVVYNDPQWKSNLGASFALRCFQRLRSEERRVGKEC